MEKHNWEIEVLDGGPIGDGEFWICKQCGASGGPRGWFAVFGGAVTKEEKIPSWQPFLASTGLKLTDNCDESKKMIEAFNLAKEEKVAKKKARKQKKRLYTYAKVFKSSDMPFDVKNEFLEVYNNMRAEYDEYVDWNTTEAKDFDCAVAKWLISNGAGRDEVVLISVSPEQETMQ